MGIIVKMYLCQFSRMFSERERLEGWRQHMYIYPDVDLRYAASTSDSQELFDLGIATEERWFTTSWTWPDVRKKEHGLNQTQVDDFNNTLQDHRQ